MAENKRIQWIDVARGICLICIIAGHFGMVRVDNVVYSFHVAVFFILSGYTLKQQSLTGKFLKQKFIRLMVPYFLTCLCVMLMDLVNSLLAGRTSIYDITSVISNDFFRSFAASGYATTIGNVDIGSRIGAIWFFPALFFALIFALILINHVKSTIWRLIIAFGLFVLACVTVDVFWLPFSIQSAMMAVLFILLGHEMRQRPEFLDRFDWKGCLCALAIFIICLFGGRTRVTFASGTADDLILSLAASLSMSMVVIYCSRRFLERVKPLAWIGRKSLLILCVHLFALETMWNWFDALLNRLPVPNVAFTRFLVQLIFAIVVAAVINQLQKIYAYVRERRSVIRANEAVGSSGPDGSARPSGTSETVKADGGVVSDAGYISAGGVFLSGGRDTAIDIARGILITLMIVGHFGDLEPTFRAIIYSFHMMAFVLLSGYFFSSESCENLKKSIIHLLKTFLIPYAAFSVIYVIMQGGGVASLRTVLLGVSFTDRILVGQESVGPVYFILMLFVVRILYMLLRKVVPNELWMHGICLAVSVLGAWLGVRGFWLPWSVDCALYAIIFYHLGYCFKKYKVMEFFRNNPATYFILSIVWAFMIYCGGMELAIREYMPYGLVLLGALSGSILLYMCSGYLARTLPRWAGRVLRSLGQSTLYILIITALFNGYFNRFVARRFGAGYIYHMVAVTVLELAAGVLVWMVVSRIKRACAVRIGGSR